METKPKRLDLAAQNTRVNSVSTKNSQSSFAGRTFGVGSGNKTFMTKEVMSALDKETPTSKPTDSSAQE